MNSKSNILEDKLMPIATRLSSNKALVSIRDGIALTVPLLVGSVFMIIASFPIPEWWADWLTDIGVAQYLTKGVDSSFGLLGLIASFGIARSLAKQYDTDGVAAGVISLTSFIIVSPFVQGEETAGIEITNMGAQGLFVAIVVGLLSGYIFQWFINKDIQIKMPEGVPVAVGQSFNALIPGTVIISFWLLVYSLLDAASLPDLHNLAQTILGIPLGLLGSNIWGTMAVVGLNGLFWFVGLHGGNTVNQIMSPIWLSNLDENLRAFQAGNEMPNIITGAFMDNFVYIGGGGATLGLTIVIAILALRKNASKQTKLVAPLTFLPGIFNINEPAMFGLPIVLNIVLIIPLIIAPIVNIIIAYFAMSSGLVPLTRVMATWTMPPILSGFLTTGSISGSILQIILIVIDTFIYLPFYLSLERGYVKREFEE